jgi:hypothetical protein
LGNWSGSGHDGIGAFDPGSATWFLRNERSSGAPDPGVFSFGASGWIPLVGDWTGAGQDGIGVFDPSTATWYLRNTPSAGAVDITAFVFGSSGWIPVTGDWTGSGKTGIGTVDPATETWYLRNTPSAGAADIAPFAFGAPGDKPVTGEDVTAPELAAFLLVVVGLTGMFIRKKSYPPLTAKKNVKAVDSRYRSMLHSCNTIDSSCHEYVSASRRCPCGLFVPCLDTSPVVLMRLVFD